MLEELDGKTEIAEIDRAGNCIRRYGPGTTGEETAGQTRVSNLERAGTGNDLVRERERGDRLPSMTRPRMCARV